MATIQLRKSIAKDTPRDAVAYATLAVLTASDIPREIFVTEYCPPSSYHSEAQYLFHHVAYVDEFTSLPTLPDNIGRPQLVRRDTVRIALPNEESAEQWCREVYREIQRLLQTYDLSVSDTEEEMVSISEASVIVTRPDYILVSSSSSSNSSSISGDSSSSSSSTYYSSESSGVDIAGEEEVTLTFDGTGVSI